MPREAVLLLFTREELRSTAVNRPWPSALPVLGSLARQNVIGSPEGRQQAETTDDMLRIVASRHAIRSWKAAN